MRRVKFATVSTFTWIFILLLKERNVKLFQFYSTHSFTFIYPRPRFIYLYGCVCVCAVCKVWSTSNKMLNLFTRHEVTSSNWRLLTYSFLYFIRKMLKWCWWEIERRKKKGKKKKKKRRNINFTVWCLFNIFSRFFRMMGIILPTFTSGFLLNCRASKTFF